jgi:formylglycine-generating enzyme required for sulfatase activity
MKFVWIKADSFRMGSPKTEKDRQASEIQHTVELTKGFYMGVFPVTQDQWNAVISPDYVRPAEGFDLSNPSRFRGVKNLPVDSVSWNDCQLFIKKLTQKDGRPYRLPTEAEWEFACRAGTTTPYHFGETLSTTQANFASGVKNNDKKSVQGKKTMPVGSFPPNAWGLHDMHGNVAQWCQDRYGPYPSQYVTDPQGGDKGGSRVLRGGSWEDGLTRCRSASRAWDSPDNRGRGTFGVRICFTPE